MKSEFYKFIQSIQNANKKVFARKEAMAYLHRVFPPGHYGPIKSYCDYNLKKLLDLNYIKRINRGEYEITKKI